MNHRMGCCRNSPSRARYKSTRRSNETYYDCIQSKLEALNIKSDSETSLASASGVRSARKDLDYRVSESGVSVTCMRNASHQHQSTSARKSTYVDVADSDMPYEVQRFATSVIKCAVKNHAMPREIAKHVKEEMDGMYGPAWQCHVGQEFGIRISFLPGNYMFVTVDSKALILYKSD